MATTVIPGNAQGLGHRSEQQDAFGFSDLSDAAFCAHSGALCVVCDGMGGHAAGARAAAAAVNQFLAAYCGRDPTEPISRSLQTALQAANNAVLQVAADVGESGSTLVAAVIHRGLLRWISIGDSRLLLLRSGRLHRVNREHRYRGEQWRALANRGVPCDQALTDPRGDLLTSSLGEQAPGKIDRSLRPVALQAGDHIYLATDGLYRVVETAALLEAAAVTTRPGSGGTAPPPDAVCAAWLREALAQDRPDQDNITVAGMAWQADAASARAAQPARAAAAPDSAAGRSGDAPSKADGARLRPRRVAVLATLGVALGVGVVLSVSERAEPYDEPVEARPHPPRPDIAWTKTQPVAGIVRGEVSVTAPASSPASTAMPTLPADGDASARPARASTRPSDARAPSGQE